MQAPKARTEPRSDRRLLYLVAFALSGLVALGAVIAFLTLAGNEDGGADASLAAKLRAAGCTFDSYPALKPTHIQNVNARPKWNSSPPTSGPHFGQWAIWDAYDAPVPLTMSTHNLEHGGIVMHYGPNVPDGEIEKLREFYDSDSTAMLLSPLPTLGDRIALSAWYYDTKRARDEKYFGAGKLAKCTRFDEEAFTAFRDAYRFKGSERIPAENLARGS